MSEMIINKMYLTSEPEYYFSPYVLIVVLITTPSKYNIKLIKGERKVNESH